MHWKSLAGMLLVAVMAVLYGCGASDQFQFTYVVPPTVTGVSPARGPVGGGTSVVITGANLAAVTAVKFGAANAASFAVNSDTQITAISPAGSTGIVDITVTTAQGTSATSASDLYTYEVPLAQCSITGSLTEAAPGASLFPGLFASIPQNVANSACLVVVDLSVSGNTFTSLKFGLGNFGYGAYFDQGAPDIGSGNGTFTYNLTPGQFTALVDSLSTRFSAGTANISITFSFY